MPQEPWAVTYERPNVASARRASPAASGEMQKNRRDTEQVTRLALSKELGVENPEVKQGFAAMSKTKAAKARTASAKTRRVNTKG